ncbi:MAG TPA: hypothetical protein VMS99_17455 [Acidimicrobiia bacterium]|nr:hypothetical protein [Acidimicrobiia bacterium]
MSEVSRRSVKRSGVIRSLVALTLLASCVSNADTPTTTNVVTTETTTITPADVTPSQTPAEANRDGVVPDLAALPYSLRVEARSEVPTDEGTWIVAVPTPELTELAWENGCGFGNLDGAYPTEVICVVEYGEILLVDGEGQIVRAFPMPGGTPFWIHATEESVYGGRIGDGALPNSTLFRIDRQSLEATVVVILSHPEDASEWLPTWHVAGAKQVTTYDMFVGFAPETSGTRVTSWIGDVVVDISGIDEIIDQVAG